MGYSRKRAGRDGKHRYTAFYWDHKGRERSAGTFSTLKDADKAWQRAEVKLAEGRLGDPARGRMTFQRYVEDTWLPNHEMEPTTRQSYTYSIYKNVMPEFGPMRMADILPEHVREWVGKLKSRGVTPVTIRYNKLILSAIFTTAFNDQIIFLHPGPGREDAHNAPRAQDDHHARPVRRALPGAAGRGNQAAHRDRHRERPAVG